MWGLYCAKTRDELDRKDPQGRALLEAFLPPMMQGYEALIEPTFMGTFSLTYDPAAPYTHKSRWYVDARLTGSQSSNLLGNDADNRLTGNRGDNTLHGGAGSDIAVFEGTMHEYEVIEQDDGSVTVRDLISNRDGHDRLIGIEHIQFGDGRIRLQFD